MDCIPVNKTDLDRLETKFRKILRNIQSLPDVVATPAIYLCIGQLPAIAERDIEILGLLGQIAQCPRDLSVAEIVEDGLIKFDINFEGWSGLARKTCVLYGLEDPLDIIQHPWRSDRWQLHCKQVVTKYWLDLLIQSCESYSSLNLLDTSRLDLESPHPIWTAARRDAVSTKRATFVMWIILGCYNTSERLFKMGLARTPYCLLCAELTGSDRSVIENREHFLLSCSALQDIRKDFLRQFQELSPVLANHMEVSTKFLVCLLDPYSPQVPDDLRRSWIAEEKVYETSRNFCYSMHNKRTKLMEILSLKQ